VITASDLRLNGHEFDPRSPPYRFVGTGMDDCFRGRHTTTVCYQPLRLTQPLILCGTGNEFRPKCSDALQLGVKAEWLIHFVDKRVGDNFNTCHSERFRDEFYEFHN